MTTNKIKHFYFNKYIASLLKPERYYLSYNFKLKVLWFRVYKVASRTINWHLKEGFSMNEYIYSSPVAYLPALYKDYFKFAFVRDPIDRFVSAWSDKVIAQNYFSLDPDLYRDLQDINAFIRFLRQNEKYLNDIHLKTQTSLIDIENIDFIGKFENFEHDFTDLAKRIGITYVKSRVLNRSPKVPYSIEKDNIEYLKSVYWEDYSNFYPDKL